MKEKELEGNIKKLNSLFEENYLLEHENDKTETSLAILKKNELFVQNNKYVCGLDMEKAITDRGYNEEFDICDAGLSLASEYGNGFKANVDGILSTIAENNVGGKAFYSEFIGDANRLDKEVYRNIQKQLAEYISEVMKKSMKILAVGKVCLITGMQSCGKTNHKQDESLLILFAPECIISHIQICR